MYVCMYIFINSLFFLCIAGMNPFGNHMGMQSMGQRSTPPLPHSTPLNQVITVTGSYTFCSFVVKICFTCMHKMLLLNAECFGCFREAWAV